MFITPENLIILHWNLNLKPKLHVEEKYYKSHYLGVGCWTNWNGLGN